MTLIKSISGIRGTIGGLAGDGLTPADVLKFATAFAVWVKRRNSNIDGRCKIVIGRDARISGEMVSNIVTGALQGMGVDVIDLGLSTTPTVEVAVPMEGAQAGIILTASHNPKQWNALKLLNEKGEFVSAADGAAILELAENADLDYPSVDDLGQYAKNETYLDRHIEAIKALDLVKPEVIAGANFKVAVDAVNSTGGIFVPALLRALGVADVIELYCEPTGEFPHNPEPLPAHLTAISEKVVDSGADLGIVVDPDVDRLAFVCEDGSMFGEEYTLVAVADYVLRHTPGNTVSNLSSTRALRDVTEAAGGSYHASAVGEVNVVEKMKEVNAVIGGEGNGGVIYPDAHYGRDALVGLALFLSHLAILRQDGPMSVSALRKTYNDYHISKNKIELGPDTDVDAILVAMKNKYREQPINDVDGVKIEFDKEWVHLRKSNTEPIIRIYAESASASSADDLAGRIIADIKEIM